MSPVVSVIVPAYNAQPFLEECIESLLAQTVQDLEIIVVDDGSTDSTPLILDSFGSLIRVIRQPNGGVSAARNAGLKAAKGEYIAFCDADDTYHAQAMETMLSLMGEEVDIVSMRCDIKRGVDIGTVIPEILSGREAAIRSLYQNSIIDPSPWAKLYRRSLFDGIDHFKEGMRYEDLELSMRLFSAARRVAVSDKVIYFYRQHGASFLHTWSPARLDALTVTQSLINDAVAFGPEMEAAARSRAFSAAWNILFPAIRNGRFDVASRCRNIIRKERAKVLKDSNVRIKNRIGAILAFLM